MLYRLAVLTPEFEERVCHHIEDISSGWEVSDVTELKTHKDTVWSFLIMHWSGLQNMLGIPDDIAYAKVEVMDIDVDQYLIVEAPVLAKVPLIDWCGVRRAVSSIRSVISCVSCNPYLSDSYLLTPVGTFTGPREESFGVENALELFFKLGFNSQEEGVVN
jgi:hypothetical protein